MTTRAGVGLSLLTGAGDAAREAASRALARAGTEAADWALLFATSPHRPHYGALLQEAQNALGTERVSGCSAWGVIAGTDEIEGPAAVAVLAVRSERLRGDPLLAPIDPEQPMAAAAEIHRQARLASGGGLLILLPDPFVARPDELLAALERLDPGREAVGGACSGDPAAQGTFQFYGRNVATRSLAGVRISGALRRVIGVTQGCQPLGGVCRVSGGEGNVILELDGEPALAVLRSRLPAALRESLPRLGNHLALGWPPDPLQETILPGEYLVRPLIGVDSERGALVAGATVRQGQPLFLVLRDPHAAREDLKEMLARLGAAPPGPRPAFGLYFNCAGRGTALHGVPGIDTAYISGALGDLPLIGFFGNAEIAPLRGRNRVFTYTGVLVLVAEED
jgi:small ligand-binding sensory domain FIST